MRGEYRGIATLRYRDDGLATASLWGEHQAKTSPALESTLWPVRIDGRNAGEFAKGQLQAYRTPGPHYVTVARPCAVRSVACIIEGDEGRRSFVEGHEDGCPVTTELIDSNFESRVQNVNSRE